MKKNHFIAILLTVVIALVIVIGGAYAVKNLSDHQSNSGNLNQDQSSATEDIVKDYIEENISTLSPEDAVLGGIFYVTSIRFTEPGKAIVDYEDGHIALTARTEFEVSNKGNVNITYFELDENSNGPDFRKKGNLTQNAGAWQLVYEEPGKPALTAKLNFNDYSICYDEYEDKSCSPTYWEEGARAEIVGYFINDTVLVSSLRIISEVSKTISGEMPVSNFRECVAAGNEAIYPDCIDCSAYCETESGEIFEESSQEINEDNSFCEDQCGNGVCDGIVCMGEGCPCPETPTSCPQDCA